MRDLRDIMESVDMIEPNYIKYPTHVDAAEAYWDNIPINLNKYKKYIDPAYIESIKRHPGYEDPAGEAAYKSRIIGDYVYTQMTIKFHQTNKYPIVSIGLHSEKADDKWSSMSMSMFRIELPKKPEPAGRTYGRPWWLYSEDEIRETVNALIQKIIKNPAKAIKYMTGNWCNPNEYHKYEDVMKKI
jgi:hypothetical protein